MRSKRLTFLTCKGKVDLGITQISKVLKNYHGQKRIKVMIQKENLEVVVSNFLGKSESYDPKNHSGKTKEFDFVVLKPMKI